MLRRGGQQALQRLPCLVEWASQAQWGCAAGLQRHRSSGAGDEPPPNVRFNRHRTAYKAELSQLRKQWAEERQKVQAVKAEADEAARLQRLQREAAKQQHDAEAKEELRLAVLAAQQADRERRLAAKAARLQRQALRNEVLEVAREERRQWLLTRSRNWVTPETLEQRIREAIDNPVPLYQET